MHIQSQLPKTYSAPRASTAKTEVNQALDRIESCLGDTARARADALASKTALEGYEADVKAIKFDRPDRDVSAHGVNLKAKTEAGAPTSAQALQLANGVKAGGVTIKEHIDNALKSLTPADAGARRFLETAQREAEFLNESSVPHLAVSLKHAHRQSQEDLSPYLTEVIEDAPGRDVGRFSDDIKALFSDSVLNYRQGELGGKYVASDLDKLKSSLLTAREKLK